MKKPAKKHRPRADPTRLEFKLKREVIRRQVAEASLRAGKRDYARLLSRSRLMEGQLRQLSRQILRAQEEERKQISRELHDEIAQTLAGISVYLASLKAGAGINSPTLAKNISLTQRLVEKSVDIVHRFARELRPTVLDDLGLIAALHSFLKGFTKRTRIRVLFTTSAGLERLDSARRTVFFRVAQEALTNVAKHAGATTVKVRFLKSSGSIRMEISDNGKSFRVPPLLSAMTNNRLGLIGMRERVEMVGGVFGIVSKLGKGTTVHAEIPCGKTKS